MGKGSADTFKKGRVEKVRSMKEREREVFRSLLFCGANALCRLKVLAFDRCEACCAARGKHHSILYYDCPPPASGDWMWCCHTPDGGCRVINLARSEGIRGDTSRLRKNSDCLSHNISFVISLDTLYIVGG